MQNNINNNQLCRSLVTLSKRNRHVIQKNQFTSSDRAFEGRPWLEGLRHQPNCVPFAFVLKCPGLGLENVPLATALLISMNTFTRYSHLEVRMTNGIARRKAITFTVNCINALQCMSKPTMCISLKFSGWPVHKIGVDIILNRFTYPENNTSM